MKRLLNKAIILALMVAVCTGCSHDEVIVDFDVKINSAQESESDIPVSLNLNIPDPLQVSSRDVTEAVENFTVLCFDKNDNALTKLPADIVSTTGDEAGILTVKIPNATRVMHVFANQGTVPFVKGMSEYDERLTNLAATENKMVYWGRIEVPSDITSTADVKRWWTEADKTISLLRSHAKIEVVNNNPDEFVLQGYTVVRTNASGLAIPYDADKGVYPSVNDWVNANYIYAATGNNTVSGTAETMQSSGPIYVYETSASAENPASIIIKGYNTSDPDQQSKYWRVAFAGEDGNQVNIRRNHCYTVSIEGNILFGDETFEAAVANTSTANSAWLSIADEVTAIKNRYFSMTVENTSYIMLDGTESFTFNFTIEQLGDEEFKESDLSVTWAEGQQVSSSNDVNYTSTTASTDGKTIFTANVNVPLVRLASLGTNQEGTIVIKYGKNLQRKVKVIIIPQQEFNIVSYNDTTAVDTVRSEKMDTFFYTISVNKADYEKDEYTIDGAPIDKLKFKLPINFPAQLLPLNILVSTTDFNVVNSPLIFEGAGGYGDKNIGPGYKYVYPVNAVLNSNEEAVEYEIQLRYINNVLADKVELTLEAENFKPVKLVINYTTESTKPVVPENKDDAPEEGGSEA